MPSIATQPRDLDIRTVGDMGQLPDSLPLNLDTLLIVLPYSAALAVVGLLESLMTATIVDEMTDTGSDKSRNARARAWRTSPPACSVAWLAAR